jgi:hypothetical protein
MIYYNKRANYVGEMGISTPCYTTMKEQNYVSFELYLPSSHSNDIAIE